MSDILKLNHVDKIFYTELGELRVLENISFSLQEGEILSIIGPSGSGKSTILNIISGLIKPTHGEVILNGEMGYMFQYDHLLEWRTIWKNILLGLEIKNQKNKISKKEIINQENKVYEMLKKYDLNNFTENYPSELSGGMRQRIALIRTLAINPQVLLLDEPFSALDYQNRLMVCDDVYRVIKNEKKSAILVTHDISEAISISDRIIVLSKRPAQIKAIHKINLNMEGEKTPLKARTAKEFQTYFDIIWKEINSDE